jgi:predicted RNA-binding protein (TIGR00451 family)
MFSMKKIRSIADYQFGKGVGKLLFPDGTYIIYSCGTGRIRHIYLRRNLIATLRPTDGLFSLTLDGGRLLLSSRPIRFWILVQDDIAELIAKGRTVFAKHVIDCDLNIRPREEVVVINSLRKVLGVGKAVLTGKEIMAFNQGVAVKIRHGANRKNYREK